MLVGKRRVAANQIFRTRSLRKPFKNELDRDPRPTKNGLAKHYPRYPLDVLVPFHNQQYITQRSAVRIENSMR